MEVTRMSERSETKVAVDRVVILRHEYDERFPATITEKRCLVDDAHGYGEDSCVWDENKPEDCSIANRGTKKADCKHWRDFTWHLEYDPNEIWQWLEERKAI